MMKYYTSIFIIASVLFFTSCRNGERGNIKSVVHIQLKYGENKKDKNVDVTFQEGMTALTALQSVAIVETHPVGQYIFVTSIDNVRGERGVKAWYYKQNGKSTKKLAVSNFINANDTITWIYTKDICSCTVDNKK